jgi:ubiquitin-conjugating enzyme E2 I
MDIARMRLTTERKELQMSRPWGMYARPRKAADGSIDLFTWELGILPKATSVYALPDHGT